MHVLKVQDKYSKQEFQRFPNRLYRDNTYWVQSSPEELDKVFETENNDFLKNGSVCRWILQNYRGATIGRIAAFVDRRGEAVNGYLGFFESIDHQKAALRLLEEGSHWLERQGVSVVNAPVNPTSLFLKSGLLTQGFERYPHYGSNYHPDYYQGYFESFGFEKHLHQRTYHYKTNSLTLSPSMLRKAENVLKSGGYTITFLQKENLDSVTEQISEVYNQAWQSSANFYQLSAQQIRSELQDLLPWIDENIFLMAYRKEQLVGFFFNLPDINQARRQTRNGVLRKMREAYFRKVKHKHLLSVLLGVLPEFQNQGVGSALIKTLLDYLQRKDVHYEAIETNRVSDSQEAIGHLIRQLPGEDYQHYWIYSKPLGESAPKIPEVANQTSIRK